MVTTMNSNISADDSNIDLISFVARFLREKGAVLESENQRITALLPEDLSAALNVDEEILLVQNQEKMAKPEEKNVFAIQFQTPFLDTIVSMAGAKPPFLQADLTFNYIKTQGFENLIREQFEFHKSKIRVTGTAGVNTRYLLLECTYLAESDEQKKGFANFSLNLDTGAMVPGMSDMLVTAEKQYHTDKTRGCSKQEIKTIHELVKTHGLEAIEPEVAAFKESMNRRFRRDGASLETYYHALENEMKESLERTGLSQKVVEEREAKIAMIPDELAAKQKDLLNKYAIRISFTPAAALAITTPCVKVFVSLVSGRQRKDISMIYNPVTKRIDPVVCSSCGASTYSMGPDENMALCCINCL